MYQMNSFNHESILEIKKFREKKLSIIIDV